MNLPYYPIQSSHFRSLRWVGGLEESFIEKVHRYAPPMRFFYANLQMQMSIRPREPNTTYKIAYAKIFQ